MYIHKETLLTNETQSLLQKLLLVLNTPVLHSSKQSTQLCRILCLCIHVQLSLVFVIIISLKRYTIECIQQYAIER